jgi:hypothetical protein
MAMQEIIASRHPGVMEGLKKELKDMSWRNLQAIAAIGLLRDSC